MIKKINPYNLFKLRKLERPPQHFEYMDVPLTYNLEEAVCKWIDSNLKSRYYVGKTLSLKDNQIKIVYRVGFEDAKELSYFTLACPHLKY